MHIKSSQTKFSLLLMCLLVGQAGNLFADDKPLLMEGKKALYQRVLSIPEARLYEIPVASSAASLPPARFSKGWCSSCCR